MTNSIIFGILLSQHIFPINPFLIEIQEYDLGPVINYLLGCAGGNMAGPRNIFQQATT